MIFKEVFELFLWKDDIHKLLVKVEHFYVFDHVWREYLTSFLHSLHSDQPIFQPQQAAVFREKALINPLYATFSAPNSELTGE